MYALNMSEYFHEGIIKMTAVHWPPWIFLNDTSAYGPMKNIADNLARTLGFKYTIKSPEDGQWGVLNNGNWSGMVGMIFHNRSDIALGPIALTLARTEVGDYSAQMTTDYLTILSGIPNQQQPNAFGSLMAFDWTVWTGLMVSLTSMSLISFLFECLHSDNKLSWLFFRQTFGLYFDTYFKAMFCESTDVLPIRTSLRMLNMFWWLGIIVLMNAFTGHMKAMMMVKPEPKRINTMKELSQKNIKVFVWKGTAYEALLRDSPHIPEYSRAYSLMLKYNGSFPTKELYRDENINQILRGRAVVVSDVTTMKYHVARTCRTLSHIGAYHFATEQFFPHKFGVLFHKAVPVIVKKHFNKRIRWMLECGLIYRWMHEHFGGLEQCEALAKAQETYQSLDLEEIQSVFWVWLIGLLMSIIWLITEKRKCGVCLGKKKVQSENVKEKLPAVFEGRLESNKLVLPPIVKENTEKQSKVKVSVDTNVKELKRQEKKEVTFVEKEIKRSEETNVETNVDKLIDEDLIDEIIRNNSM